MYTQTSSTAVSRNSKEYEKDFEKELRVYNLRTAVELFGKEYMRKHFKQVKRKLPN